MCKEEFELINVDQTFDSSDWISPQKIGRTSANFYKFDFLPPVKKFLAQMIINATQLQTLLLS